VDREYSRFLPSIDSTGDVRVSMIRAVSLDVRGIDKNVESRGGGIVTVPITLEDLARQALDGDRDAIDRLVQALQGDLYALALRMLWHREDAEDATQEILMRIVTRLPQFEFRSRLKTWAYRLAVNYILDVKKSAIERQRLDFGQFAENLVNGLEPASANDRVHSLLIDEVKVGCSLAMLQCLDRPHRAAYVLGEIMELSGPEAAEILDVSPGLFRKRLQLARDAVVEFMRSHCGLVSDTAPCQCHRRVSATSVAGVSGAQPLQFARHPTSFVDARAVVRHVDEARWAREVHRTSEPGVSAVEFAERLLRALDPSPEPTQT
jgi:RNA polymerase sigma factor (sigma-70 family)